MTDLLKALKVVAAHPIRIEILHAAGEPLSPTRFLERIGQRQKMSISSIAYHFRALVEVGALELVDTRQVRGTVEHLYLDTRKVRVTDRPDRLTVSSLRS